MSLPPADSTNLRRWFSLLLMASVCGGSPVIASSSSRPNILVIVSDDQGWADLGLQGVDRDIRTPHLDQLAKDGVRFTRGYVTAPQCMPSRCGLITGRYQQRFGVEDNNQGPLPLQERTLAELLQPAGYLCGFVGKSHLDITGDKKDKKRQGEKFEVLMDHLPPHQGFAEYFRGEMTRYYASHRLDGKPFPDAPRLVRDERFRVEVQTEAALSFLERRVSAPGPPWLLYFAPYAPHVPLESPEPWFSRTPENLPLPRRQALAMVAAMDEGIGRIRDKLKAMGADQNTLIFFISDNGAPLGKAWDGSINLPMKGQKGMLAEGGIRVPFLGAWPGHWPAGKVYDQPVSSLDFAATVLAAAGLPADPALDGVNLAPFITGRDNEAPHGQLYWRWGNQSAVLEMPYKLILLGNQPPMLFDVTTPEGESVDRNLAPQRPELVARLKKSLESWAAELQPPGLPGPGGNKDRYHDQLFLEHGLLPTAPGAPAIQPKKSARGDSNPNDSEDVR